MVDASIYGMATIVKELAHFTWVKFQPYSHSLGEIFIFTFSGVYTYSMYSILLLNARAYKLLILIWHLDCQKFNCTSYGVSKQVVFHVSNIETVHCHAGRRGAQRGAAAAGRGSTAETRAGHKR